jgi:hypothetical protein
MYSIDFMKIETQDKLSFHCSDFWLPYCQRQRLIQKMERSDAIILGTLVQFRHFRHFMGKFYIAQKRSCYQMQNNDS